VSYEFVQYEKTHRVVTIRLNRPQRRNSLGWELVRDLDAAWRCFADDDDALVAIYTGTGVAFCSGMDIKEAANEGRAGPDAPEAEPLTIFHAGLVPKPVIAAVNGFAVGGGFFDVLRCDLRLAAESASFQLAEVLRCVLPRPLIEGIAGALPQCLVTELALGWRIDAARAFEMGLINAVVSDDQLMARAHLAAQEVASLSPLAVMSTLEGLRRARAAQRLDPALVRWEAEAASELLASSDHAEAVSAFLEKREPVYGGSRP
jgi:enoyl-CoA hydratase/carnithine racemase